MTRCAAETGSPRARASVAKEAAPARATATQARIERARVIAVARIESAACSRPRPQVRPPRLPGEEERDLHRRRHGRGQVELDEGGARSVAVGVEPDAPDGVDRAGERAVLDHRERPALED